MQVNYVKLYTYTDNLTDLRQAIADTFAPFEDAKERIHAGFQNVANNVIATYKADGSILDVTYWNVAKTKTYSNGAKSIAMLKIPEEYIETMIEPMVEQGVLECLGGINLDGSTPELSASEWIKVRNVMPKAGTSEEAEVFGETVTVYHPLFDMA